MTFKSYRQESKINYGRNQDGGATIEQLNCGALMRIADATEKMCLDREKLERDYQYMRADRDTYRQLYERECRKSAARAGVITRMKRKGTNQ